MLFRHFRIGGSIVSVASSSLPLVLLLAQSCRQRQTQAQILSRATTSTAASAKCNKNRAGACAVLPFCASAQSLLQTKQAHAIALLHGLLPRSVPVCASLVLRYATFGDLSSSLALFHLSVPFSLSPYLCNTLIRALSVAGVHDHFETYNKMMLWNETVLSPDQHTFTFVLKVCADHSEIQKGREIHGSAVKLGFGSDLFVRNTLVLFYGAIGDLTCAKKVFDEMLHRDIVSWNTMIGAFAVNSIHIEALYLFVEMNLRSGFMPDTVSIVSVLPVCAALGFESMSREIHCNVVKVGLYSEITICNALVDAYGKCVDLKSMMRVFNEMSEKNEVSYNATITSFAYSHKFGDALGMFRHMVDVGLKLNSITISSMIPVMVELDCFLAGKELHGFSLRSGMVSDVFISNSLIDMYAKFGHSNKASVIFCNMNDIKNAVSWNAMIANFAQNNSELEAVGLVRRMQAHGEVPNSVTFTNVLPACARIGLLQVGKEIHGRSIRTEDAFDVFVSNALVDMYAKCRCLKLAQNVFDNSLRDEITYNTLIVGYSQTSDCLKSLYLFLEMRLMGMAHGAVAFVGVLSACANHGAIKQGKEIHGFLVRKLLHTQNIFIANSLVDFYSKCGQIELARKIFDQIPIKDIASWNTMILGYGMLGETDIAINLFEDLKSNGVLKYDSISYISILTACSHCGLLDKGRKYFDEMGVENIKPTLSHYACMVDLLGRAGYIEGAAGLISGLMTMKPGSNIWGAMLGACRSYGNLEMGCLAAEHLLELAPDHSGYYALLSNMYAEAGRWDDAHQVRELMKFREVKKNPGRSWV